MEDWVPGSLKQSLEEQGSVALVGPPRLVGGSLGKSVSSQPQLAACELSQAPPGGGRLAAFF